MSFFSQALTSQPLPHHSDSAGHRVMGNGHCAQSVTAPLFCSILFTLFFWIQPGSSHRLQPFRSYPLPLWALHRLQLPLGQPTCVLQGLPCGYLLQHTLLQELWGISFPALGSTFSCPLTLVLPLLFHAVFPSIGAGQSFLFPSSKRLFLRHHQLGCGLSCALEWIHWSWLEAGRGQPLAFSPRGNPCSPFPWAILPSTST